MNFGSDNYILYADDDREDQEMLKDVVREIDPHLKVLTVNAGGELLEYLSSLKPGTNFPCLIVVDMNMPKLDGIETLKQLKSDNIFRKLPVIIFSTSDNPLSIQMAKLLGATDYVKKPVTSKSFVQIARHFLALCQTVPEVKDR
jgi:CheY-like chemotaxis protein